MEWTKIPARSKAASREAVISVSRHGIRLNRALVDKYDLAEQKTVSIYKNGNHIAIVFGDGDRKVSYAQKTNTHTISFPYRGEPFTAVPEAGEIDGLHALMFEVPEDDEDEEEAEEEAEAQEETADLPF